jgi:Flp pilus assembly protein TadB
MNWEQRERENTGMRWDSGMRLDREAWKLEDESINSLIGSRRDKMSERDKRANQRIRISNSMLWEIVSTVVLTVVVLTVVILTVVILTVVILTVALAIIQ